MSAPEAGKARRRWRPRLALVLAAALTLVAALPLAGIYVFRIYENQLVRATEGELIAQGAALAAMMRAELAPDGAAPAYRLDAPGEDASRFTPILPDLDLTGDGLLPRRPEARPAAAPPDAAMLALGAKLAPVLRDLQRVTLAGARLLDARGVVVGGREEIGLSLAHVEEVARALNGEPARVLRRRVPRPGAPPLYSLSRGTTARVFVALPVMAGERVLGVVYLSRTPANIVKHLYEQRARLALAAALVLLAVALAGAILHRAIASPVKHLVARAGALARGDRAALAPLVTHGAAEFARLADAQAAMAAALYRRSDYLSTFARHVSHELKSPLTAIRGAAELMREADMTAQERDRFLANIEADAARLDGLLARLRELARAELAPQIGAAAPREALARVARARPALTTQFRGAQEAVAMAAEPLDIVLGQLCDNALSHGATRVAVVASVENGRVALHVADDGAGVAPAHRARLFEPFFTTRRESGGAGMGLAILRALIEAHGGSIAFDAAHEGGAAFRVFLPSATTA